MGCVLDLSKAVVVAPPCRFRPVLTDLAKLCITPERADHLNVANDLAHPERIGRG